MLFKSDKANRYDTIMMHARVQLHLVATIILRQGFVRSRIISDKIETVNVFIVRTYILMLSML